MATEDSKNADYTVGGSDFLESDVLKRALERIAAMPEGEEKERQKFILAQDYPGLKDVLGTELADAETLLNTEMPEGRQAGQVYVAANPMEHLSAALRQGLGAYRGKQTRDALRQLSADKGEALKNTMFPGQQQQVAPQPTQPQKPDLGQYGVQLGQNPQGAGMGQVSRAIDRRQSLRSQGITPPPMGEGRIGQAKQAAGVDPKSNMLRAMGGMGKPDLARYGAPNVNAGMGQFTQHLNKEAPRRYPMPPRPNRGASGSWGDANLMREENPWDNDPMAAIPRGDETQMLFDLLKRNRR